MSDDNNLTTEQTALRIGVSPRTLEKWRMTGEGPAFLPAGKHRVVYPVRWIVEWEEERKASSTAQVKRRRLNCSLPMLRPWRPSTCWLDLMRPQAAYRVPHE